MIALPGHKEELIIIGNMDTKTLLTLAVDYDKLEKGVFPAKEGTTLKDQFEERFPECEVIFDKDNLFTEPSENSTGYLWTYNGRFVGCDDGICAIILDDYCPIYLYRME